MKKWTPLLLAATLCLSLPSCTSADTETSAVPTEAEVSIEPVEIVVETENSDPGVDEAALYQSIMEDAHIEVSDAYEMVKDISCTSPELKELSSLLEQLDSCQGTFLQIDEELGDTYTAEVSFYLENGTPYCHLDYTNYSGELSDGEVFVTKESGYLFESFPQGQFLSRTQDFSIYFGVKQLHIQWAGICDYLLTRGSGSAVEAENVEIAFEDSDTYTSITEALDKAFSSLEHHYEYWDAGDAFYAYVVASDGWKDTLLANRSNSEAQEKWSDVVEAFDAVGSKVRTTLQLSDYSNTSFCLCMVTEYKGSEDYSKDDMLYIGMNGETVYNFMDDSSAASTSNDSAASSSADESDSAATTGEKNALQRAKDYLELMAFSYSGLIDQLEYDGYTYSEAEYAADHCGADWNEQAAKKAADYLDLMSFSRQGLIGQLEYDGFTTSQAEYGVSKNGY